MMEELQFIYKRYSVRKFQEKPVKAEDLEAILTAAVHAPSGKNLQNWHFVVVSRREMIEQMAGAVQEKNKQLAEFIAEDERKAFTAMIPYHTVFKGAPVVILVYAGPYPSVADSLLKSGRLPQQEALEYAKPGPGIQNIAAAMENLVLAAAALGYGTCWMTGPTYAAEEISKLVGFSKEGYHLAAMTPLGVPAASPLQRTKRKPLAEVVTFVE
ncbi:hypothetical protein P22_3802 [Propionispora sp. 2/2-37]|uniref:nitroreductase family protein n=1 Tax=Propionispora sp. 2/2-37 TaxID=1677858 RepID=UPI0006C2ECD8|nr:nitroreductase family protein [Propionispora sp. 2/2-37]CUH97667.1 hypothetical protein P22_3802 [Propionispora sp. 2/2-37]